MAEPQRHVRIEPLYAPDPDTGDIIVYAGDLVFELEAERQVVLEEEPRFREVFYKELLPGLKRRGKTVIVITHDDRYFGCADQLVKLDFGQIAAVK